ncbi:hypothetical protein HAZT_HAZT007731, partial [Hyalella azteca]
HLQNFWGASGNFWQHQWDRLLNAFGDDLFNLMVYGGGGGSLLTTWLFAGCGNGSLQPPDCNWVVAVVHF